MNMSIGIGIAMAVLVLRLLAARSRAAVTAVKKTSGRNCPSYLDCGEDSYDIQYPFGIGPECSLPGFNLTCAGANKTMNIDLLLGNPSIGVLGFDQSAGTVQTSISYFVKLAPGQNYSAHWEAPGRAFAISGSSNMSLFVVGCTFKASLFIGDSGVEVVGSCYVACVEEQIMQRLPFLPCVGMGCCRIDITEALRSFTLKISRTSQGQAARGLEEQVSVFITDRNSYQFTPMDLVLYDSVGYFPIPQAALSWAIPNQLNCKRAMEDEATYACVSNRSKCQEAPIGGYVCNCEDGFYGNPYVVNGCVLRVSDPEDDAATFGDQGEQGDATTGVQLHEAIGLQGASTNGGGASDKEEYANRQPKANCPTSCGNVTVPFPFGIEVVCSANSQMRAARYIKKTRVPRQARCINNNIQLPQGGRRKDEKLYKRSKI